MKKIGIIGIPYPFKKGGPESSLDNYKRDGEQPQDTFVPRVPKATPPNLPEIEPEEKNK